MVETTERYRRSGRSKSAERARPVNRAGPVGRARRVGRRVLVLLVLAAGLFTLALLGGGVVAARPLGEAAEVVVAYRSPTAGAPVVVRGFDDVGPYAPGHRGVDLRVAPPGVVLAAAAGTVTFAGQVAGRGVVTVQHADGIRTSYEPLAPTVAAGTVVAAGAVLGTVSGAHGGFAADTVLHWGARRGDRYLDPLVLLEPLGPVRLLPWASP